MRTLLFPLFLAFLALPLMGQNPDSVQAEIHVQQFSEAQDQENYSLAAQELDKAIALFRKADALGKWVFMQEQKSYLITNVQNKPFDALQYMDNCMAKEKWRAPRDSFESLDLCYFYLYQAYVAKQYVEDFVRVKAALEKAYAIFHKDLKAKNDGIATFLYFQLGNTYIRLREFNSAKRVFDEGLAYSIKHNAPQVAKYSDHGGLYIILEDYPKAKQIFLEGVARDGVPEEDMIFNKIALVECLTKMKDFDGAAQINKALEAQIKKPLKTKGAASKLPEFRYNLQENNGIFYDNKGRPDLALYWYREALKTSQNYPNGTKRQSAFYQNCIGELLLKTGKPAEALRAFHAALQTMVPKFVGPVADNPNIESLKAENVVLLALQGKARAYRSLGELDKALACYELIPIVEAKIRSTHAYESSSLQALKESRQRFQEAVDIAWQLFERSIGNPQYAERAFRLTELARGMLLLQSLVQARQFLPEAIQNQDYDLRVRMAWLEHEIAAEKDKGGDSNAGAKADLGKIKDWERQLFELKLERQRILADFPSYNNPDSFFLEVLAAKEVHKLLRPDQAMANYFLTETAAYIFSFDAKGDFRWRKAVLPPDFREQTRGLASYLWVSKLAGQEQFLRHAWLLDSLLLGPERARWGKSSQSLVIVPDDVLMLIPFEVLLSNPPSSNGAVWREQPWLLVQYNIGYAFSATLLKAQSTISVENERAVAKPPHVYGGFAPTYSTTGDYKLQKTCSMVKNVQKMLGGHAWCDVDASEARFKNSASDYRTLLLAMHGFSNPEHPELSHLLFGDPGPDSLINNNKLYAPELQIMRLRADLVVLSACYSGSGKLEQGEGIFSLARAFAAARVPATVMSLWLFHEDAAPPLVEGFFKYLQAGKTKDEALRLAKLDFLNDEDNFEMTHPFFWAGLAASGDMRALDLPWEIPFYWWIVGATVLLGMGLWWRRWKKH
jgi:CHAT domain-containing protein/tetratricopeptide (TPR) repeat protein